MVVYILFWNSNLSLLFEILALNRDGKIIAISFLDLYNNANGHGFLSKGHFGDFVEHGAAEADSFYWADAVEGANFDQGELFNMIIANQYIVFIAADAGRFPIGDYGISFLIQGFIGS